MRGQRQHVQLGDQFRAFGNGRADADSRAGADPFVGHDPDLREPADIDYTQLFRLAGGNRHTTEGRSKRELGTHNPTSWLLSSAPFTGTSCRRARWRHFNFADGRTSRGANLRAVRSI